MPTVIGIAVVAHGDRFLVGTRSPSQDLAGAAEFPGGKCVPGETSDACAVRECVEETGLEVVPVQLLHRVEFTYPHATVDLHFWLCHLKEHQPEPHSGFEWVSRSDLASLPFPAGNADVVRRLTDGADRPN